MLFAGRACRPPDSVVLRTPPAERYSRPALARIPIWKAVSSGIADLVVFREPKTNLRCRRGGTWRLYVTPSPKEVAILKPKVVAWLLIGVVLLVLSSLSHSGHFRGPFTVKLELSHMPQLNEEVALICSVASTEDVDSARVAFWIPETLNVKVVKGERTRYCSFRKNEIKEFKLLVSFPDEGIFLWVASARLLPGGAIGNSTRLIVKTYKDKKAVLLESIPWRLPKNVWIDPGRPGLRDSIEAVIGSLRVIQR